MRIPIRSTLPRARLTPLAACFAAMFALSTPAAATTWTVNTCADDNSGDISTHTGTLRFTVANAASGDTIDMTTLHCSTISLLTGAIVVQRDSLKWNGPGMGKLNIEEPAGAPARDRVINHLGNGDLDIYDLSISNGNPANNGENVYGGCIYSRGSVLLSNVVVQSCSATAGGNYYAYGGAIFTKGALSLKYSDISGSHAEGYAALGGGAFVGGYFLAYESTVENNSVASTAGGVVRLGAKLSQGGGLYLQDSVNIEASTISGNSAGNFGGGIVIEGKTPASETMTLSNSTISGNTTEGYSTGIFSNISSTLQNSTIAFNTSRRAKSLGNVFVAPGLALYGDSSITVDLQSSIIASNTYGSSSTELDFSAQVGSAYTLTMSGLNNLIRATASTTAKLPGTLTSCPLLGPLRNNGGLTATHALLSRSPAINAGNNAAGSNYDQRGSPYLRVSPSGGKADIGAYEVQKTDIIFNNGFDGCP